MNNKISLTDLTDQLSEDAKITKKEAAAFLKLLFDLIEENLINDKIVKIKSLGTFKLIWVESRRIANVNTGEIQEIPDHYKTTFTPDADLSEAVNEPFAHLETIILDDEIIADEPIESEETPMVDHELPLEDESEQFSEADFEESSPAETQYPSTISSEPDFANNTKGDEEKEKIAVVGNKEQYTKKENVTFNVSPKSIFTVMKDVDEKPLPEDEEIEDSEDEDEDPEGFKVVKRWIISLLVLAILAFTAYYLYNNYKETHKIQLSEAIPTYEELAKQDSLEKQLTSEKATDSIAIKPEKTGSKAVESSAASPLIEKKPLPSKTTPTQSVKSAEKPLATQASAAKATIVEKKEPGVKKEVAKESPKKEILKETTKQREKETANPKKEEPTKYKSGKNIATEVMKSGSRLTLLAKKYYGNKAFWVYIYQANKSKIANPDNVPIGTEIVIPAKESYPIDPNNKESVEKAKKLATSILK